MKIKKYFYLRNRKTNTIYKNSIGNFIYPYDDLAFFYFDKTTTIVEYLYFNEDGGKIFYIDEDCTIPLLYASKYSRFDYEK